MAARRGKSQARRNSGNGIPGWAWLILGVVLTIGVILAAPKLLKSDGKDGFFRPKPNPDAQPAASSAGDDNDAVVPEDAGNDGGAKPEAAAESDYDFYTLLPGKEVKMSDAELAATAREEEARQQRAAAAQPAQSEDAADLATPATTAPTTTAPATAAAATTAAAAGPAAGSDARYILQAGAFGASGDAEALKARIALLGLNARVESAVIKDKTVYRVRMGPYGTASELAEAKGKLGNGGLPAMAIKAK
ncbi:SPOR domain-containing protein [Luteimonas sp. SX5]|uniref:SPOR domain-containing protein n=1 Tax=Luteimonas galliterrae TaxID=2940486 RepID=A0ABT0MLY8_9GAMM|nr:SPOR domain-containing protein [Luteimonas galliterrae]MCL1635907.1 SPOR domain-containing protein [Luteimonas galliterrae]